MSMQNPLVTQLGYPSDARLVIFHADDVGMSHGSNQAYLELCAAGILQTGSVMIPCPWSPELVQACQQNPTLDIGVHLTLTSEWAGYRWGPISTRDPATGLVDDEGCFWHRVEGVQSHLQPAAAVQEMRAQIERVRQAGVDFTHLDTHMGAALLPDLVEQYAALGFAYGVPVLLPRRIDDYIRTLGLAGPDESTWLTFAAAIEAKGMPLVDWFRITPAYHTNDNGDVVTQRSSRNDADVLSTAASFLASGVVSSVSGSALTLSASVAVSMLSTDFLSSLAASTGSSVFR